MSTIDTPSPPLTAAPVLPAERAAAGVARLTVVHFVVDAFSNTLASLGPLLVARFSLSLAAMGSLTMLYQVASSVSQLAFGRLADRGHAGPLALYGSIVAAVSLGLVGATTGWWWLLITLFAGGLGVAAFHPAGALLAYRLGASRPGHTMAVFITGGTLGFAAGPLAMAAVAERFGSAATAVFIVPALAIVIVSLRPFQAARVEGRGNRGSATLSDLRPYARPLSMLYGLVVIRGFISYALTALVPIFLTRRGASMTVAAAAVAAYHGAGGVGGFCGGTFSDRVGHRRVILGSMVFPIPFLLAAPSLPVPGTIVCLAMAGLFLQSTLPVNVSYGQMIAPANASATVASLLMGFAWGMGGFLVPLAGACADRFGLQPTLTAMGLVPILGVVMALNLPRTPHVRPR